MKRSPEIMSQSHYWFSTDTDYEAVIDWLQSEGAEPIGGSFRASGPKEIIVAFPNVGPIEYWPDEIHLADFPESSPRWRSAVLALNWQRENLGCGRLIDSDFSAVAQLCPPYRKTEGHWVGGELHFPTSKLKERYPELHSLCGRFERWLRKRPLVYDNTKRELFSPFEWSLCTSGIVKKVYAFPEAHRLLQEGACMCDWSATDFLYSKFLRTLELQGRRGEPAGAGNGDKSPRLT
jgi:hypothetical protein